MDITYVHTWEGFVYLAFILDVYSRKVVGWSIAYHLRADLVVDALKIGLWRHGPSEPCGGAMTHPTDSATLFP